MRSTGSGLSRHRVGGSTSAIFVAKANGQDFSLNSSGDVAACLLTIINRAEGNGCS